MSSKPVVFVAWDSTLDAVQQAFTGIQDDPDEVEVEILGAIGDLAWGRLRDKLDEAVNRSAAVLAVVDQPNANMAWEVGMALSSSTPARTSLSNTNGTGPPSHPRGAPASSCSAPIAASAPSCVAR